MKAFWHTNLPIVGSGDAPPAGPFMVSLFVYAVFLIRARSAAMHSTWSHELGPEMEEQNEAARGQGLNQPTPAELRAAYGDGGDDDGDSEELAALDEAQEASAAAAAVAAVAAFEAAEGAGVYSAEQLAGVAAARVAQAEAEAAAAAAAAAGADVVVVEPPLPANSGWAHYT